MSCHSMLFAEARLAKVFRMYIARLFAHVLMRRLATAEAAVLPAIKVYPISKVKIAT